MYEVEFKLRADHDPVRRRLHALGAAPGGTVRQVDTYYDAPDRDFAETDEALRLREETTEHDESTAITYKGPLVDDTSKSRVEHQTRVRNRGAIEGILDGLGFEPAATVEKERERFDLDGYTVTLDDVDGLGEFVEVETETTDDDIADAREGARAVLESLGLDPDTGIRTAYLDMLLAEESAP